jgi:hypothetical protein
MLLTVAAVAGAAAVALFLYVRQERLGWEGVALAALRTAGLTALVLLVVNPAWLTRRTSLPAVVLLDQSLSMGVAGGSWLAAVDSAVRIAGPNGTILGFGRDVGPFVQNEPLDGFSRVGAALATARALGGPTTIITDGEVTDAEAIPRDLLRGVRVVHLPRQTLSGVALLDVHLPGQVEADDSLTATITLGTWGSPSPSNARVEVFLNERRLAERDVDLPTAPATVRRQIVMPPRVLGNGEHALAFRLQVANDAETRDNERWRVISVSEQPSVMVIVDPADWEGRFLVRGLSEIAGAPVRSVARIGDDRWVDMRSMATVSVSQIRGWARGAALLVIRGRASILDGTARATPSWRWLAGDERDSVVPGDWYLTAQPTISPLAAGLARVEWDSLPPLTGVVPATEAEHWVALTARQARRGVARPVLMGTDSGAARVLFTRATGFWRWSMRGGAGREAIRTVLATGLDWLLRSEGTGIRGRLVASPVVARGVPVTFEWARDRVADSAVVFVSGEIDRELVLRFDAEGIAQVDLEPGVYRWSVSEHGASGVAVVEAYSDEYPPASGAALTAGPTSGASPRVVAFLRERWWPFVIAVIAFLGEWAWRQRRGLP